MVASSALSEVQAIGSSSPQGMKMALEGNFVENVVDGVDRQVQEKGDKGSPCRKPQQCLMMGLQWTPLRRTREEELERRGHTYSQNLRETIVLRTSMRGSPI